MGKEELICELHEAFTSNNPKALNTNTKKYFEDTQTLYAEAREYKSSNQDKPEYLEFLIESETYSKISSGKVHCCIVNKSGLFANQEIILKEVEGLSATGRFCRKTILDVCTYIEEKGLSDGYFLISF